MKPKKIPLLSETNAEISALIEVLHKTGQRLDELTAGEVDSVTNRQGLTSLLPRAQEQLRVVETTKQAAILNALPAIIALLDTRGFVVSVNDAWRQFGVANPAHTPGHEVGGDYLATCDPRQGDNVAGAYAVVAGIRSVLSGKSASFSIEYPCNPPTTQQWFLMTVTPLNKDRPDGAVVVLLDITEQKLAKDVLRELVLQKTHSVEHDFLTGLPNRILLNGRAGQAIALAKRHLRQVAVLFLDLDGFKQINDSLGYATGDKLLQRRRNASRTDFSKNTPLRRGTRALFQSAVTRAAIRMPAQNRCTRARALYMLITTTAKWAPARALKIVATRGPKQAGLLTLALKTGIA